MVAPQRAKILFYLTRDSDGYPPVEVESVWARSVEDGYMIDNIPFYAKGVSYGDTVSAEPLSEEGATRVFSRVLTRGGHSTFRIYLVNPTDGDPLSTIRELRQAGFEAEYDLPRLISVDVPPEIDLEEAEEYLFRGVDSGRWELEGGYRAGDDGTSEKG